MVDKYFGGSLPDIDEEGEFDKELEDMALETKKTMETDMDTFQYSDATTAIWKFISRTNKYIDETAPWALAKDESKKARLASVLRNLIDSIRMISIFVEPFMPETAVEIRKRIGANEKLVWSDTEKFRSIARDFKVHSGAPIFPRLDTEKELAALEEIKQKTIAEAERKAKESEGVALIGIEDFAKVSLKVAKVTDCVEVPKSKKLLKLTLKVGSETRIVASGIKQWYTPNDLIGKKIILVYNLKPAKLCGVMSEGMILAADASDGSAKVIFVSDDVEDGAQLH
jgi:methionyl-tRNA synthetase